ncbi:phosphoribosylformylglycinamidine synthase subunit PurQ [Candidatus Micrarchaeota archaeon]|nr:phosphoribosylformylglycinamidine synthase subunit PurQ [Candidatus Micrarchaeota archaeon]
MNKVKSLVITGYGINCEREMSKAFERAGAESTIRHINDVINGKVNVLDYNVFSFPGGFSFGDDLGSAQALANLIRSSKIKTSGKKFLEAMQEFIAKGGVVYGICNGFQVMVKFGMLPGWDNYSKQSASLAFNDSNKYEVRWVQHKVNPKTKCIAFKGIEHIYAPVRHGEGKFVVTSEYGQSGEEGRGILARLHEENNVLLQYAHPKTLEPTQEFPFNPNGSIDAIAGLSDATGRVFGHMTHTEAFQLFENHPCWAKIKEKNKREGKPNPENGEGMKVYENIVSYLEEKK